MPSASSSRKCADNTFSEMPGISRLRSLNRLAPSRSSHRIDGFHLPVMMSSVVLTGQSRLRSAMTSAMGTYLRLSAYRFESYCERDAPATAKPSTLNGGRHDAEGKNRHCTRGRGRPCLDDVEPRHDGGVGLGDGWACRLRSDCNRSSERAMSQLPSPRGSADPRR